MGMENGMWKNAGPGEPAKPVVGFMGLGRRFAAFSQEIAERYTVWESYPWSGALLQFLQEGEREETQGKTERNSFFITVELLKLYLEKREAEKKETAHREPDSRLSREIEGQLRLLKAGYDRCFGLLERIFREGEQMPEEELRRVWTAVEREMDVRERRWGKAGGRASRRANAGKLERPGIPESRRIQESRREAAEDLERRGGRAGRKEAAGELERSGSRTGQGADAGDLDRSGSRENQREDAGGQERSGSRASQRESARDLERSGIQESRREAAGELEEPVSRASQWEDARGQERSGSRESRRETAGELERRGSRADQGETVGELERSGIQASQREDVGGQEKRGIRASQREDAGDLERPVSRASQREDAGGLENSGIAEETGMQEQAGIREWPGGSEDGRPSDRRRIRPLSTGGPWIRLQTSTESRRRMPDGKERFQNAVRHQQQEYYSGIVREHVARETSWQAERILGRELFPLERQAVWDYAESLGQAQLIFYADSPNARPYEEAAAAILKRLRDRKETLPPGRRAGSAASTPGTGEGGAEAQSHSGALRAVYGRKNGDFSRESAGKPELPSAQRAPIGSLDALGQKAQMAPLDALGQRAQMTPMTQIERLGQLERPEGELTHAARGEAQRGNLTSLIHRRETWEETGHSDREKSADKTRAAGERVEGSAREQAEALRGILRAAAFPEKSGEPPAGQMERSRMGQSGQAAPMGELDPSGQPMDQPASISQIEHLGQMLQMLHLGQLDRLEGELADVSGGEVQRRGLASLIHRRIPQEGERFSERESGKDKTGSGRERAERRTREAPEVPRGVLRAAAAPEKSGEAPIGQMRRSRMGQPGQLEQGNPKGQRVPLGPISQIGKLVPPGQPAQLVSPDPMVPPVPMGQMLQMLHLGQLERLEGELADVSGGELQRQGLASLIHRRETREGERFSERERGAGKTGSARKRTGKRTREAPEVPRGVLRAAAPKKPGEAPMGQMGQSRMGQTGRPDQRIPTGPEIQVGQMPQMFQRGRQPSLIHRREAREETPLSARKTRPLGQENPAGSILQPVRDRGAARFFRLFRSLSKPMREKIQEALVGELLPAESGGGNPANLETLWRQSDGPSKERALAIMDRTLQHLMPAPVDGWEPNAAVSIRVRKLAGKRLRSAGQGQRRPFPDTLRTETLVWPADRAEEGARFEETDGFAWKRDVPFEEPYSSGFGERSSIVYASREPRTAGRQEETEKTQLISELETRVTRQEYARRQDQMELEELQRKLEKQEQKIKVTQDPKKSARNGGRLPREITEKIREQLRLERIRYGAD